VASAPPDSDFSKLDIRAGDGFCILRVKVTPKASRNQVVGVGEGALRLRIHAPPVDGAANDRAREYLAEVLGRPRGAIQLERGQTSRDKAFRISGITPSELVAALEASTSRDPLKP